MNSEERHQLHENDLAATLDRGLRKVEPYSNQILIGVLAVTVLAVGFLIWQRSSGTASAEAWGKFAKAATADDYLTVADDFPNTTVAPWARLRAGEQFLNQGLRTATSDRKSTEDNLKQAQSAFESLLSAAGTPPQIRERALYGLAVARETLSTGDTTKAVEAYETLRNEFPTSPYANLAALRVADLKSESTQGFYAWFDKQPRKPEERPKPKDLMAGPRSGSTADPFVLDDVPLPRASHPDRPPSPARPSRPEATAEPFPNAATAPASTPASEPTDASAAPVDNAPGTSATPPANEAPTVPSPPAPSGEPPASSEPPVP